jgi:hypothetical protein
LYAESCIADEFLKAPIAAAPCGRLSLSPSPKTVQKSVVAQISVQKIAFRLCEIDLASSRELHIDFAQLTGLTDILARKRI